MTAPAPPHSPHPGSAPGGDTAPEDESTGLPGLGSWNAVYLFVTATFIAYVALLFVLPRMFR